MTSLSDYYFNETPEMLSHANCGKEVPSILSDYVPDYPSMVDRFFSKYYYRKPGTNDEDHMVLFHSNRICLIGLAHTHIALRKGIKSINYNIGKVDRSQNKCSGKGKKGAMNLQPDSALAILTCIDGSEYKVLSAITCKLIEVNSNVVENPKLLSIEGDGYIAIGLPKPENCDKIKNTLLTKEQYLELIKDETCEN